MNILIVSTWNEACGIAEHSAMLMDAVTAAGGIAPTDRFMVSPELLDPAADWPFVPDILHLNYHAALHSRWSPAQIKLAQGLGCKVLVTYHDSGVPNSDQCKAICAASDYFVIHEPYDDLPAHGEYLKMGVPAYSGRDFFHHHEYARRPILGTAGHDFDWKCWGAMAQAAKAAGWGLRICTPLMSAEREADLRQINPWLEVHPGLPTKDLIDALHDCDATAITMVTHNAGQSAAILSCIAARKPVIALSTCRMLRSLYLDPLGRKTIRWCSDFEEVEQALRVIPIQRVDPGIVALAEQEAWRHVGRRYAEIYRSLCA